MDTIKRFIDCGIPTYACNFRCHYCYVTQNYLFTQKVPKFKYSSDIIGNALSKNRLGGTCLFNICASGETLIPNEVISYVRAILEQGHYVMVVTNGIITKRLKKILKQKKKESELSMILLDWIVFLLLRKPLINSNLMKFLICLQKKEHDLKLIM